MSPATVALTLTQGEAAAERAAPPPASALDDALGDVAAYIRQAINGWSNPVLLPDEHRTVYLLLADNVVVKGWMSMKFLGRATWWTWDPRVVRMPEFQPGFAPRILPRCVAPLAWCEIALPEAGKEFDPRDQESEA